MSLATAAPSQSSAEKQSRLRSLNAQEWALVSAVLVVILTAHVAYGSNKDVLGVILALVEALLALAVLATKEFSSDLWAQRRPLGFMGALFLTVVLIAAHPLALGNSRNLEDLSGVVSETIKLLGLGCIFLVGCVLGARGRRAETFLRLSGLLLGVYAIYSIATFKLTPDRLLFGPRMMFFDRLTGTFGSANSAATLMGMGTVLNMALAMVPRSPRSGKMSAAIWSAACLGAALVCGAALLMTASRGGFVSTLIGVAILGVYGLFRRRDARIKPLVLVSSLVGVVAVGVVASTTLLGQRLSGTTLNIDRFDIFKAHWPLVQSHPFWGLGAGNFTAANNLVLTPQNYGLLWNVRATHNVFIQWMEEAGSVSLGLMMIVVIFALARTLAVVSKRRSRPLLAMAVLAASAVVLVHGLSDFGLQNPSIAAFWATCLGLGFGLWRPTKMA